MRLTVPVVLALLLLAQPAMTQQPVNIAGVWLGSNGMFAGELLRPRLWPRAGV